MWRKSTHSLGGNGECVEVAVINTRYMAVRDSKNINGRILSFSFKSWRAFIARMKALKR